MFFLNLFSTYPSNNQSLQQFVISHLWNKIWKIIKTKSLRLRIRHSLQNDTNSDKKNGISISTIINIVITMLETIVIFAF